MDVVRGSNPAEAGFYSVFIPQQFFEKRHAAGGHARMMPVEFDTSRSRCLRKETSKRKENGSAERVQLEQSSLNANIKQLNKERWREGMK